MDTDSSLYEVSHCFDQILMSAGVFTLCIPNHVVTFTCGSNLTILDTYFAWGSANAASNMCNQTSGCADPKCDFIEGASPVTTPLLADFFAEFSCVGLDTLETVSFINTTSGGSTHYSYSWDLGDGTMSNDEDVIHQYNASGDYAVQLIVSDTTGLADTIQYVITVESCAPSVCTIVDTISYSGCIGDGYELIVGDSLFNEGNPIGSVHFTTTDGCDSTIYVSLQFDEPVMVEAGMLSSPACSNAPLFLDDLGAQVSGGTTLGSWTSSGTGSFDNAGAFGGPTPSTQYSFSTADIQTGSVILTLTTEDPPGSCSPEADAVLIEINDLRCQSVSFLRLLRKFKC